MDRNTTIGLVLIFAVLIGFSYLNRPSQEEIEAAKRKRDSIEMVQRELAENAEKVAQEVAQIPTIDSLNADSTVNKDEQLRNLYGDFAGASAGTEKLITLENNLMRLVLSNKGGKIHSVELKNFKRFDASPLYLIEANNAVQNLTFFAQNRMIRTDEFYFEPSVSAEVIEVTGAEVPKGSEGRVKYNEKHPGESQQISLKLNAGENRYIEYIYKISHNSYVIDFDIRTVGMGSLINTNTGFLSFNFEFDMPRQERYSSYGEDRYSSIYYKFKDDELENLNLTKTDSEDLKTPVQWIGYKQLFFSTVLTSAEGFPNATISSEKFDKHPTLLGHMKSDIGLAFDTKADQVYDMSFYFGPNHYQTLKGHGNDMEKIINLGWPVVREINRYVIIPVFNFLEKHIASYGLIILLLTLLIRIVVTPFTFKSYVSQAKMRALKPEIDEINKKFTAPDKAMEKQQAVMSLYKKAGVNPMGGCLPMLFQMPVLIAMFYFFPGSIELRQESFLWATDLSTYDSIFSLPFTIPMYGDHVSLFTLLMTITTVIQTKMTSNMQDTSAMPGMKYMLYFMPFMFMFILNSYSSGLSYYYFLANVITIGQTYLIRQFIDEDKVRAQIIQNKKKPVVKSKFQQRLEEMTKQQQDLRNVKKK